MQQRCSLTTFRMGLLLSATIMKELKVVLLHQFNSRYNNGWSLNAVGVAENRGHNFVLYNLIRGVFQKIKSLVVFFVDNEL